MYIGLPGPISVALMQACKSILQKRLFDGVSEIFFVCFVFLSTLSLPNNVLCFQANYNFHPKNVEFGFRQTPDVNKSRPFTKRLFQKYFNFWIIGLSLTFPVAQLVWMFKYLYWLSFAITDVTVDIYGAFVILSWKVKISTHFRQ